MSTKKERDCWSKYYQEVSPGTTHAEAVFALLADVEYLEEEVKYLKERSPADVERLEELVRLADKMAEKGSLVAPDPYDECDLEFRDAHFDYMDLRYKDEEI